MPFWRSWPRRRLPARPADRPPLGSLDELRDLPFTTKDDLLADQAAHPPFGTNLTSADRQRLLLAVPTALLEELPPRSHPLCDLPLELQGAPTADSRPDEGAAKPGRRSQAVELR